MRFFFFLVVFFALLSACSTGKKLSSSTPSQTSSYPVSNGQDPYKMMDSIFKDIQLNINCLKTISSYTSNDHQGPITLKIEIDSIHYADSTYKKSYIKIIKVNKNTGIIYLDSTVALNIFHLEAKEYGNLIHLVRFDFYINNGYCWERKYNSEYSEIGMNNSFGEFSIGYPDTYEYFKVVWNMKRTI